MSNGKFEPMKAAQDEIPESDYAALIARLGPLWVTDKEDGIRCATRLVARSTVSGLSRKLIKIPNLFIQRTLSFTCVGLDGELMVPGMTYNEIQTKVMTKHTLPFDWEYVLFDFVDASLGYLQRLQKLRAKVQMYGDERFRILEPTRCDTAAQLKRAYRSAVERGKEGLIGRPANSPYKYGRSTLNEGWMLKFKQSKDSEAIILDFEEELENLNPKQRDNTGKAKRSHHKANLRGKGRLGAMLVRDIHSGIEFWIGTGLTHAQREYIWAHREEFRNTILCYSYHSYGIKDKPRQPKIKGFRKD